jgi:serine phosphatase RsbU (regulator of sigma subunit)/HAMP domain-containing protein
MSLQRRLTKGILAVLGVIIIFMALNLMSYWDIDAFVTLVLPPKVTIARTYERFGDNWNQLFEKAKDDLSLYNNEALSIPSAQIEKMSGIVARLKNLIESQERMEELTQIEHYAASFTKQLNSYYLLLQTRNRLQQKSFQSRQKAARGFKTEALNLLERFKSMLDDFNAALKNPDFKASLGKTSSLLDKIARIEKDLVMAETEVALYISQKDNISSSLDPNTGKKAATRVETRLRAILFLLENSINESDNPISKRVLSQVEKKIRQFYDSFQKMRNILETPRGELLEIEDQLITKIEEIAELKKMATDKASKEAEFFWRQIFYISDQIKEHASYNHSLILAFLALVFIAGIYTSLSVPKKIGGPLKQLNQEIANFRLGNEINQLPASGTEEIDSIAQAFKEMAQKLNLQAEVNRNYLESIHSLTKVYRELHETRKRIDQPTERLEKAINSILEQLITQCPKIDLLKVMVKKQALSNDNNESNITYFVRLGDPCFSEKFINTEEHKTYCKATRWKPDNPSATAEEIIPEGQGLTGYFAEEGAGVKTGVDSASFFQAVYQPQKLLALPTLKNRDFEQGLAGCLFTEPLNLPIDDSLEEKEELGILFVYFMNPETKLSWQDIFFIQIIASQLASIIETDKLLHERDLKRNLDDQLDMAKQIQDNLLPHTIPEAKNLKITKFWKSAAEVGGDYYDFFALSKNRLGIVIADASGKNVPAAIIMTVFKTALSTMDLNNLSASEVLTRANKVIEKNITPDRFITAMYVIIDCETGNVELSSAGHNPAFVASGRGMELILHEKNVNCIPLGIVEDFKYESITFTMKPKDQLFLYTDGVTEARNADGKEFSESGLKRFLALPRPANPATELGKELLKYSKNAGQHDDITAVSIEFKVK